MKRATRLFSLVALVLLCAIVSVNAQNKKQKVALIHNGHIIVVAPEAVPAHLAHGDTYANEGNTYTITIINLNPSGGSISGPTMVAAGDSATYAIAPADGFNFVLLDGNNVLLAQGNTATPYVLTNVSGPVTLQVNFY